MERNMLRTKASRTHHRARAAAKTLVLGAAASVSFFPAIARAANVVDTWLTATNGTWTDATKWSAGVPNNAGASTFSVTVGATGSAYTVTLNSSQAINDFTLSSANATVAHTSGTLTIAGTGTPFNISAGTYSLQGGTISGGTITTSGSGTLAFTSGGGALFGTKLIGNINLSASAARVRMQNGADFTGNATLSASSSIL